MSPTYHPGGHEVHGDLRQSYKLFTYETTEGLVSGTATSILFTVDRPAEQVWPYLKDFNLWQNKYGHFYSAVLGDLYNEIDGGLSHADFRMSPTPDGPPYPNSYQVIRVVPEYLIVIHQPVPTDGSNGGVSRGFHAFMLSDFGGTTTVTIMMSHATRTKDKSVAEALAMWREMVPEWRRKWRESFVPTLKTLIRGEQ